MKRVAIIQSNYVPWRGYFDMIRSVDEFILLDDIQYTKHSWRNRNRIKTSNGIIWLTIPVRCRGGRPADAVEIADPGWANRHLKTLASAYGRAIGYQYWEEWLKDLYLGLEFDSLSHVNRVFLERICRALGIFTPLTPSQRYPANGTKSKRVLELCLEAGAQEYVSSPAARSYLDEGLFRAEGVAVRWFEYPSYPPYQQRWPPYEPRVSILDLLLNTGPDAGSFFGEPRGQATAVGAVK